jgi:hypothetical protein
MKLRSQILLLKAMHTAATLCYSKGTWSQDWLMALEVACDIAALNGETWEFVCKNNYLWVPWDNKDFPYVTGVIHISFYETGKALQKRYPNFFPNGILTFFPSLQPTTESNTHERPDVKDPEGARSFFPYC